MNPDLNPLKEHPVSLHLIDGIDPSAIAAEFVSGQRVMVKTYDWDAGEIETEAQFLRYFDGSQELACVAFTASCRDVFDARRLRALTPGEQARSAAA